MALSDQTNQELRDRRDLVRLVLTLSLLFANSQLTIAQLFTKALGADRINQSQPSGLQDSVGELKLGEILPREMAGGGVDNFKISVPAKQYFHVVVEQQGIIVTVELFRPDGGSVVKIESVSGAHGPIHISEIANGAGDYKLEVRSSEKWANPGHYEIRLDQLRVPKPPDEERISSERAFAEGQYLISRASGQTGDEATKSRQAAAEKFNTVAQQWHVIGDYHGETISLYMLGQTYQRHLSQPNEASKTMLQALALAPHLAPNDWRLVATVWNDLGVIYDSLYNEQSALSALQNALRIFEAHHDRRGRASVSNNLGLVHTKLGRANEALESYNIALPIRRAENDKANELITLNNIGGAYDTLGEPRLALDYYGQALQGWRKTENPSLVATGLNNVARVSDRLGLWQESLNYYAEALEIVQRQRLRRNEAIILYNMGDLHNRLNNPLLAFDRYKAALAIQREIKSPRDEANILAHIAQFDAGTGRTDEALENYQRALQIIEESQQSVESSRVQVYTLIGLGTVYQNRDLSQSRQHLEKARALAQSVGDRQQEADALEKIGEINQAQGERAKARENFGRALVLRKELVDRVGEASTLHHIAALKRDQENWSEAAKLSLETLTIVESLRGNLVSPQWRTAFFAKTQSYYELYIDSQMHLYQLTQQEKHRTEALLANERRHARGLMDTLLEANADIRRGVSEVLLRKEHQLHERLNVKAQTQMLLLNERDVQQRAYGPKPNQAQMRSLKNFEERLVNLAADLRKLTAEQDDVQTQVRINSPQYAALTLPQSLSLKEIQALLDDRTLLLEYSLGDKRSYVWTVTPGAIEGFELPPRESIEQAARRVTEALTARNREVKDESFAQKNARVAKADKDYVDASAALSKMVLEPVASLLGQKRLVIVADGALQTVSFGALPGPSGALSASSGALPPSGESATGENSRPRRLIAGAAPMPLMSEYEIVYLPSASVLALQRRELGNRKPAPLAVAVLADPVFDVDDARVAKAKGNGNEPRKGQSTNSGKDTAKITPKATILPKQGTPNSTASQDSLSQGSLGQGSPSQNPASQSSANAGFSTSSPPKEQSALASALRDVGLDPNRPMPRLPYSLREAKAILQAASPNRSFSALDFKASRETATSPELSKYKIIHFATHGVLDLEHPELSGIVLSMVDEKGQPQDGYLRLHEIYNLNLPAELVVLSACQTGVGKQIKGEGLIALTRGFMYAGAKSVVASLWKVDDAATSALMAEFYKQMFVNKLKPAAALRQAQLNISQEKRWQSPYYWAGFFLQGEWN